MQLQHQIYGTATRELFVTAGIGPGMRVLDVGSGAGDVALLAADLVGPTGEVVGIEVAPETIAVAEQRVARGRRVERALRARRPARPAPRRSRSMPSSGAGC